MILDDRRKKLPRPGFGQRPLDTENAVRPGKRYSADVFEDLRTLTGLAGAQVPGLAARVGAADQEVVAEPRVTVPTPVRITATSPVSAFTATLDSPAQVRRAEPLKSPKPRGRYGGSDGRGRPRPSRRPPIRSPEIRPCSRRGGRLTRVAYPDTPGAVARGCSGCSRHCPRGAAGFRNLGVPGPSCLRCTASVIRTLPLWPAP